VEAGTSNWGPQCLAYRWMPSLMQPGFVPRTRLATALKLHASSGVSVMSSFIVLMHGLQSMMYRKVIEDGYRIASAVRPSGSLLKAFSDLLLRLRSRRRTASASGTSGGHSL
jgi:hypothetical protein